MYRKWCKTGGRLVSHYQEVIHELSIGTKLVILNDLEWCNDPYFALFH